MKTPTAESLRNDYRSYLKFSGCTAEEFKYACQSLIRERRDGEGEGEPTPREWLWAAEEAAYYEGKKRGKTDALFKATQAMIASR